MTSQNDEQIVAYTVATQPCFEDLKQVAAQLAGLLVLKSSGSTSAIPDHPMLKSAALVHSNAVDALRTARITPQVAKHHNHLLNTSMHLSAALKALHAGADPLTALELAYDELRSASHSLPGFQMISFNHACCAREMRLSAASCISSHPNP